MTKEKCGVCAAEISDGCLTEVTIETWTPVGMLISRRESSIIICNRTACALTLFTELRDLTEKKLRKTQTNAVGPTGPGFPGCAFNGD